jgi:hypothetical protein
MTVPVTTISIARLPQREHTSRSRQSRTLVPARYSRAISAGSGSTWWPHALHHTMSRTRAAAALPSVIGNPGGDFNEPRVLIPEIDIWRVAILMLKRYGDEAMMESAKRGEGLTTDGGAVGAAIWHRIIDAIGQLTDTTPLGPVH